MSTDDPARGYRRLAAAVLLQGCVDAHAGKADAIEWIRGDVARLWASELDLVDWPPALGQLASKSALVRRAADHPAESESVGGLRIRSRNPADWSTVRQGGG